MNYPQYWFNQHSTQLYSTIVFHSSYSYNGKSSGYKIQRLTPKVRMTSSSTDGRRLKCLLRKINKFRVQSHSMVACQCETQLSTDSVLQIRIKFPRSSGTLYQKKRPSGRFHDCSKPREGGQKQTCLLSRRRLTWKLLQQRNNCSDFPVNKEVLFLLTK